LEALRRGLEGPGDDHLDDETVAALATAEAAGEPLEDTFGPQLAHLEQCVECAETYADLMEFTLAALAEMDARAEALSPAEVFADLLARELATAGIIGDIPLPDVAEALARQLAHRPRTAADVTPEMVARALESAAGHAPNAAADSLTAAVRARLPALGLFLSGAAAGAWGRILQVRQKMAGEWPAFSLTPEPRAAVPLLSGESSGDRWPLFSRRVETPLPLTVEAWAERQSALACRIVIRIDRPGLAEAGDRPVQLHYPGATRTALTDAAGVARFDDVPIAAIPHLEIRFAPR
jgi:hypothetical protein